jgi:hypothetical protein
MNRVRAAVLTFVMLLATAAPASAAQEFHGIFTDNISLPREQAQMEMSRQAATDAGIIREHFFWDWIETSPGFYDWNRLDRLVGDAADRGLKVLPVLVNTPSFYSSKPPGSTSKSQFPPADPQTMARFADKLVRRYGPNGTFWCPPDGSIPQKCRTPYLPIRAWQIWNEPNYPSWWKGHPNATEYVDLLRPVATSIRIADPGAEVVAAGLTKAAPTPGDFIDKMYAANAAPFFDTLAIHPYGVHTAEVMKLVDATRTATKRNNDGNTPIWVTEYGFATGGRGDWTVSEACQAALLYRVTRSMRVYRTSHNVRGAVQFMWNDRDPLRGDIWPYYAGLVRIDGSPKPALNEFTRALAARPPSPGYSLTEACPPERRPAGL